MNDKFSLIVAVLICFAQIAVADRPSKKVEAESEKAQTVAATEAVPKAPLLKYSVSIGQFQMMTPPPESLHNPDSEDGYTYEQTMNLLRAAYGKDDQVESAATPAAPEVVLCSECEGVKHAIAEFLGKGAIFKIRDGAGTTDFQIDGIILNKTVSTSNTNVRAKKPGLLDSFIPDPLATGGKLSKSKVQMDLTVQLKNTRTGEIRSKQFAGSAEAKDVGINLSGLFNAQSDHQLNIATACADAAKRAAAWINDISSEIDNGIEVWADIVRIKQNKDKQDSMITINLGTVDGVVPDIEFEIGERLEVRPGIFIIDEPVAAVRVVEVEDYICRAKVVSSSASVDAKTMRATLSKAVVSNQ